jgi:diguanylate cyclase (GGDEF)-like protein
LSPVLSAQFSTYATTYATRLFAPWWIPVGLCFIAYIFLREFEAGLPEIPALVWRLAPWFMVGVVVVLAAAFNRGRVFLAGILLCLYLLLAGQMISPPILELLVYGLFPANMLVLALLPERSSFSTQGIYRLIFILIEVGAVGWLVSRPALVNALNLDPFQFFLQPPFLAVFSYSPLSHVTTLLLAASIISLFVLVYLRPIPSVYGITNAYIAMLLAISLPYEHGFSLFVVVASIFLVLAVISDSYKMAYLDELTGLPQRRALNEYLGTLGNQYAIAMVDIDKFKKFNDTHGHDVGDQVLQMVAARINQVRGGGKAFRYGGEEFMLVFKRKLLADATFFTDEVRKNIENYEMVIRESEREDADKAEKSLRKKGSFRSASQKVSVTISAGVAEKTNRADTAEDIIKMADKALYQSKKAGRNQVTEAAQPQPQPQTK